MELIVWPDHNLVLDIGAKAFKRVLDLNCGPVMIDEVEPMGLKFKDFIAAVEKVLMSEKTVPVVLLRSS